ncbi:MAG: hypothetical protein JSS02_18115 [Planctomycetes bacterium]|nr:hypothetical protein [Planctomycetota bacterium]
MTFSVADIVTEYPYPGLRPFEPHEADIFFGRKRHVTDLLKRLKSQRFLAVVGPSGCGKSSLIRAGLIPALQAGFMTNSRSNWNFAVFRPGNQPLLRLAESLRDSGIFGDPRDGAAPDAAQLRADLYAGSRSLVDRLVLNQWAQDSNLLILVDQFEELFRFEREAGGADESRAFVNLLLETARDSHVSAYIVITMRTDFLGFCPVFSGLPEALNDSQYLTPRLSREQIETAIVGPARMFGAEVAPDVVTRILNEMGTDPDQLPLMQHLLMRMWRNARQRNAGPEGLAAARQSGEHITGGTAPLCLTMAEYTAEGGLRDALSQHVESVYNERLQSAAERKLAEHVFRRLTAVAPDGQLIRRSPAIEFGPLCERLGIKPDKLQKVLDTFRKEGRSFLMPPISETLQPDTPIDISHESLIRKWQRLKDWTRDEASMTAVKAEVEKDAAAWSNGGRRPDDTAIPEFQLVSALSWSESHPRDVTPLVRDFLKACVDRKQEARNREVELRRAQRQRRAIAAVASVFVALSALALWFGIQAKIKGHEAREQAKTLGVLNKNLEDQAELLTKQSNALISKQSENQRILSGRYWRDAAQHFGSASRGDDLSTGLAWLVEAYRNDPNLENPAVQELYRIRFGSVLSRHPRMQQLLRHSGMTIAAASHDGRWIVTGGKEGNQPNLYVWNAATGEVQQRLPCTAPVSSIEFSTDDAYVLIATSTPGTTQGDLAVWSVHLDQDWTVRGDHPLWTETPVLQAAFLAPQEPAKLPGVVALGQSGSLGNRLRIWKSLDEPSTDWPRSKDAAAKPAHAEVSETRWLLDSALAVAPHGRLVVTWGADANSTTGDFHVWNVARGDLETSFTGVDAMRDTVVAQAAFSPGGKWLAAIDQQGLVRLWSSGSARPPIIWQGLVGTATVIAFSPDDRLVVTAGDDNAARVWEIVTPWSQDAPITSAPRQPLTELRHNNNILSARFSPDGRLLATASRNRVVRLWDLATGQEAWPPLHHAFGVSSLDFSSDGFQLLAKIQDSLQIWELASENPLPQPIRAGRWLMQTAYSDNGRYIAAVGPSERLTELRVWDAVTRQETTESPLQHPEFQFIEYACVSLDGTQVLTAGRTTTDSTAPQTVLVWDLLKERTLTLDTSRTGPLRRASFSADGRWVAAVCDASALASPTQSKSNSPATPPAATFQVQLWETATGQPLPVEHPAQPGPVNQITWNAQGTMVAVSSGNANSPSDKSGGTALWVWNQKALRRDPGQDRHHPATDYSSNAILYAAFSPDGRYLATGGADDTAYLWDLQSNHPLSPPLRHASDIVHVTFSSDGRYLATCSIGDRKACLWDVVQIQRQQVSGQPHASFEHDGRVNFSVFSPDGQLLATASKDGTARVWSTTTGELAATFMHNGNVQTACFTAGAERVATISYNRTDASGRHDPGDRFGVDRQHLADRYPQLWHWQLTSDLFQAEADTLSDYARLFLASELDPTTASMTPLRPPQLSNVPAGAEDVTSPTATAAELLRLWTVHREDLSRGGERPSHLLLADISEMTGQQAFAVRWHLERELALRSVAAPNTPAAKLELAQLYARLATALKEQRQLNAASQQYERAIFLSPQPDFYEARARIFSELKQWQPAAHDLTEAIQLTSRPHPDLYELRAAANLKSGQGEQALADWSRVIELTPAAQQPSKFAERANVHRQLNRTREAIADWTEAIARAPAADQSRYRGPRGDDYAKLEDWSAAAADFAAALELSPTNYGFRLAVVQLLDRSADPAAYRRTCDDLLQRFADSPNLAAANAAAWTAVLSPTGQADYSRAVRTAERTVALSEQNSFVPVKTRAMYLNTLGAAYYRAGRLQEAREQFDDARRLQARIRRDDPTRSDTTKDPRPPKPAFGPDETTIANSDGTVWDWLFLAMICARQNDTAAATTWLTQARNGIEAESRNSWLDRAELQILLAEAEQLLNP